MKDRPNDPAQDSPAVPSAMDGQASEEDTLAGPRKRWELIEKLLDHALELPEEEVPRYLDEACAGDDSLRAEVADLLTATSAKGILDVPAAAYADPLLADGLAEEAEEAEEPEGEAPFARRSLGRYEILGRIGRGGMGDVYEARDARLGRQVAVKILPPQMASADWLERFKREARALAALNHPNIVTIYSVEEEDGVHFLTMELVEGITLKDALTREISTEEFFALAVPLAAAVAAAHERGVTHRDLKPANVMIDREGRPKILDFGIAKLSGPNFGDRSQLTIGHDLIGTVAFMSPEQLARGTVDSRSDIFALGIIFHLMTTGRHPFGTGSTATMISAILRDPPLPVKSVDGGLPPRLAPIIDSCLEKEPEKRCPSAARLRDDLERLRRELRDERILEQGTGWLKVAGSPRNRIFAALTLVALLVVLVATAWLAGREREGPAPAPVQMRRSVAVFGFKNLSGREEVAWMSTGFAEMLTAEIAAGQKLRTIAGETVARAKRELALTDSVTLANDTLSRVRSILGADLVILGSYLATGDAAERVRWVINVQDASQGDTIATLLETGTQAEILELVSSMGGRLREELGIGGVTAEIAVQARAGLPTDTEALRLYSEGIDRLRDHDFIGARDLLVRAAEAERDQPLAHAALAEAWAMLGYDARAEVESSKAVALADDLPRAERLFVVGRDHEISRRWDEAIESYRTLFSFFPDGVDYGLRLAGALRLAGKARESLEIVDTLRRLPAPASEDVRIDLAEAEAAQALSDHARVLRATDVAFTAGEAQGARLLMARARLLKSWPLLRLGKPLEAAAAAESAREIYADLGDFRGEAEALNALATIPFEAGNYTEAREVFEQALEKMRSIGSQEGIARSLANIADTLMMQDDLTAASSMFAETLEVAQEVGNEPKESLVRLNIAWLALREGRLEDAAGGAERALREFRDHGRSYTVAAALVTLGEIRLTAGEVEEARTLLEEALEMARDSTDSFLTAYALFGLGDVDLAAGNLADARRRHEEALRIRTELRLESVAAESRVRLALVSIEEARPASARELAKPAGAAFRGRGIPQGELAAEVVLTLAALAEDAFDEIERSVAATEALIPKVQRIDVRLWAEIQAARGRAALGDRSEAGADLERARREAAKRGLLALELEADLELAVLDRGQGASGAAEHLLAIENQAEARGLLLLAGKASAAASSR